MTKLPSPLAASVPFTRSRRREANSTATTPTGPPTAGRPSGPGTSGVAATASVARPPCRKAGGAEQRRDPQAAVAVPRGEHREGALSEELRRAAVQLRRPEHPHQTRR